MIKHIVFFRFKEGVTDEQIDNAAANIAALKDKISVIRSMEVGRDVLKTERSFDLALVATYDSLEALNEYDVHPEHQKVKEMLAPIREAVASVDYEF
ncbi:MAG: Dabb family protein [Christensenellales bacterium]|jgi:hypothetical protein